MRVLAGFSLFSLILLGSVMSGCESSPFTKVVTDSFELKYGQSVFVSGPDVRITFTGDVYDGRCSMLCYCFW